jgi:hypothetical protein
MSERWRRPAPLLFEAAAPEPAPEHFFGLDALTDPDELLARAAELSEAFRTAAERADSYAALATAELTDPKRFDRLTEAEVAERTGWSTTRVRRMAEYGRALRQRTGHCDD